MSTELQTQNPEQLITLAIQSNANIEVLERLMMLRERYMAQIAKESFFDALVNFQKLVPEIKKDKQVKFDTKAGSTDYWYAPLASVIRQIKDPISEVKIAYQWKIEDDGDKIKVTCELTHMNHTERTTLSASPDTSGGKNAVQGRGSTVEYLKRYTLECALGLSTADDIDGQGIDLSFDDIQIKATSFDARAELRKFYDGLPKIWRDNPDVKKVLKNHETFLKKQENG